jgi:drug/metabolite transporter (DMT)-like permease
VFVAGIVTTREERTTLDPVATQAWMALSGAVLLHLAVPVLPGESFARATITPAVAGWVGYLAVVPGAWGFFVYFRLLERLGPLRMALLEYVIPPFAALFGWLVLGEGLTRTTVYGFVAILSGFLLLQRESLRASLRRHEREAESDHETRT